MIRYLLGLALLAGCASDGDLQANRGGSICPARYTLSCEVSPQNREIIASTCVCVRTNEVKSLLRQYPSGPMHGFRSRGRNH